MTRGRNLLVGLLLSIVTITGGTIMARYSTAAMRAAQGGGDVSTGATDPRRPEAAKGPKTGAYGGRRPIVTKGPKTGPTSSGRR